MKRKHPELVDTATEKKMESEKNKRPKIGTISKKELIKEGKSYKILARDFLKMGVVGSAVRSLELLQRGSMKLFECYLPEMDRFIADWALEHENLKLLEVLLKSVRPEHHLLVFEHDHYVSVKQFVQKTLQMPSSEYQAVSERKCALLKRLIDVDPVLADVIKNEISYDESNDKTVSSDTLLGFKQDLEQVSDPLEETQTSECSVSFHFS